MRAASAARASASTSCAASPSSSAPALRWTARPDAAPRFAWSCPSSRRTTSAPAARRSPSLTPASAARQKRPVNAGSADRVAAAIAVEEARAFEIAARVRLVGLGVFAVWTLIENPLREAAFYLGVIALLAAFGVFRWALRRHGRL